MSETILLHTIVSYNSLFHMLWFRNGSTDQFYWCYTRPVHKRLAIKNLATEVKVLRTRKFVVSIKLQKLKKKGNWKGCCTLLNLLKLLYNLLNMLYYSFSILSYNIDLRFSFPLFFFSFRMPLWWITILSSAGGFWLVCRLLLNICRCWNLVS